MFCIPRPEIIGRGLEQLAPGTRRTTTFYPGQALLEHLDQLEALYLACRVPPEQPTLLRLRLP